MLSNIRIVLVQTFHPGNIGATARAMKTMGLTNLVLVNPRQFPDEEATRLAAGIPTYSTAPGSSLSSTRQ